MIDLAAVATAGATAIATAAGTGLWKDFYPRLKNWFGKLGDRRAQTALKRLDASVAEIEAAPEDATVRDKAKTSWQERFEDFLSELDPQEQENLAEELVALAKQVERDRASAGVSAGDSGMAVGGDITLHTEDQSIGVVHNQGGIHVGNPSRPGPGTNS